YNLIQKRGYRSVTIPGGTTLSEFDVENIDVIFIESGGDVKIESLKNGYAGKKISIVLVSAASSVRITANRYMLLPGSKDIVLTGSDGYAIDLICSTDHGVYWRPFWVNRKPNVVKLTTPQELADFNVSG